MFEERLKILLMILGAMLLILILRLGQLQIVEADYYRERTRRALMRKPTPLPFVRGTIHDRTGEVLVRDEPCWDLRIDYRVLAADAAWESLPGSSLNAQPVHNLLPAVTREVKRWRRAGRYPRTLNDRDVARAFHNELTAMWNRIAHLTDGFAPLSVEQLHQRARRIRDRVSAIRRIVADRRGFDAPVSEEMTSQAILIGLDATQQIMAKERLAAYPWVHVEPSSKRWFEPDAVPLAHLLGRTAKVNADQVAEDPNADDPFAHYRADERVGVAGVEYVAEQTLRGRRGQMTKDRNGHVIEEAVIPAQNGRDVTLAIDAGLQRRLYHLLGDVVEAVPDSPGGAIVVLDVATREVLALVSYPSYDPNRFDELYPQLRDDTERLPLRFRAVANQYAPGSTVKPLTCLAGLIKGAITLDTRLECTGYLIPGVRNRWRCWKIHGTNRRKAHGLIDVVQALTGSCNVFMYRVGERVGTHGLCSVFDMVGIGKSSGTGLREEVKGINPTPSWLMQTKNIRVTPGIARLYAIGQGELAMTPLQVANLMATYASGRYAQVTLIRSPKVKPQWALPATARQWRAIRRGIYGVVNDPTGTAYKYARFQNDRYALCGKTGSATAHRWPTSYRIAYQDEHQVESVAVVPAGAGKPAINRFVAQHPHARFDTSKVQVETRWPPRPPPPGDQYSHAWFAGYLQELDRTGQPDWSRQPRVAFAVLVEFGGSGGRTAGPLATRVAGELVKILDTDLPREADSLH